MPKDIKQSDIVVIGGGLAGSSAAVQLAKNGKNVLLLEKSTSAHDKVCGEFLNAAACGYLHELGIDPVALGAQRIVGIRLMRGREIVSAKLPFEALSLSRRVLDEAVLMHSRDSGAEIRRGALVTGVSKESQGWRIDVRDLGAVQAETVFLATGKHDLHQWRRSFGAQSDFIGFKLHYRLRPEQKASLAGHVEMTFFDGGYAGLEPVNGDMANLCLTVTKRRFAACEKNWNRLLHFILKTTPALAERLSGSEPCRQSPLSISGVPYGFLYHARSNASSRFYRLGDQMAVIPSFSGNGMAIALHTASLSVESYMRGDAHSYHRRARNDLKPLFRSVALLSEIIKYPFTQQLAFLSCRMRHEVIPFIAAYNMNLLL